MLVYFEGQVHIILLRNYNRVCCLTHYPLIIKTSTTFECNAKSMSLTNISIKEFFYDPIRENKSFMLSNFSNDCVPVCVFNDDKTFKALTLSDSHS